MKNILLIAGLYNILWGSWVIFFPLHVFQLTGARLPQYPEIWQCVGMIVAVYGLGYAIAAYSPIRHWPIVLVGLLGKVFGPIGFVWSIYNDVFPLSFGINIIFNDLIWWIPFALILKEAYKANQCSPSVKSISLEEFSHYSERFRAKFINSLSGIKSSNLIGTINDDGLTNLCIVSSVFHLGANPALIGLIIRPDSARRDTLENIRQNKFYTINHVNESILKQSHQTSARYDENTSEFKACQLTEEFLNDFKAPFVKESKVKMAVELIREETLPENGTHLIIGKIQHVYIPEDTLEEDGFINITKAGSLGVNSLDGYVKGDLIGRLSYAKTDKKTEWL
jgi:flavin reductase (DIM6/NTAB) family NADH-FMN oxidoreductase RutF